MTETATDKNESPPREDTVTTSTVHLKAELHTSRGDYREERELMRDGVDALVLEGQESEGEYRLSEVWFQQALSGMFYLLSPIYISKEILIDFAQFQNSEIYYTRESDADVLRNAPIPIRAVSMSLYFLLLISSVLVGLVTGNFLTGALFLAASFFLPVLLIRYYNTSYNTGQRNRDRIMAEKISGAAREHETILAIVGADHAEAIRERLPEELSVEYQPLAYGRFSREHLTEILGPLFRTFSLLFTLYLVILWFSANLYLVIS